MRPALIVAIGLAVFQQLIGINTIIYYAPTTLTSVGYGPESAIYANLAIGVLNTIMTVIAIRIIDRVGRKPMLLGRLIGMVASLTVLGLSSELLAEPKSAGDPAAVITLVCLAGFIVSFAATWGPVVWVVLPEVLPLSVRGTAMGVAVCLHWGANFLVSQTFPVMLDGWGRGPSSSATRSSGSWPSCSSRRSCRRRRDAAWRRSRRTCSERRASGRDGRRPRESIRGWRSSSSATARPSGAGI